MGALRRIDAVDVMLLVTVVVWALNISVTKYVLTHGFRPLAYASIRYAAGAIVFALLTLALERTLAVSGGKNLLLLGGAVVFIFANQVAFVYALKLTTATTVALILGTTPIFTALISFAVGLERLPLRFWLAALVTFGGVALVALGSGGELSAELGGDLVAIALAATWALYSVVVAPLMRRYSPYRISAVVLLAMSVPLLGTASIQLGSQDYGGFGWPIWLLLAFAVLGPLVLTNVLWFTAIDRIGPSRSALVANLQPFLAAVVALLLLSEHMRGLQIAGGAAILGGVLLERSRREVVAPVE